MAHSLEVRIPLLDVRLINLAYRVPPHLKYSRNVSKYILRKAAARWLPKEVIYRKKIGFSSPRVKYMHTILKPLITETLSPRSIKKRGIFNSYSINRILNNFYSDKTDKMLWREHLKLWTLFIFELWCREFLDK